MKILAVTLLTLVAVATARNVNLEDVIELEDNTAFGYHRKIGATLAEQIRKAEEESNPSRIAGGSISRLGEFPFQAGLIIDLPGFQSVCGGSLLNNRRVLTAAHCWNDGTNEARYIYVVLGSVTLFDGGTRIMTMSVTMHRNWTPNLIRNDIAIVNLPTNIDLSSTDSIAPIALPSGDELNDEFVGVTATASGFGQTSDDGSISSNQGLSHVDLPVISNAVCSQSYPGIIQDSNICTSGVGGKSTCQGDSGGPLFVTKNDKRILIGVSSFVSQQGCESGFPAAFTRVTFYNTWISQRL